MTNWQVGRGSCVQRSSDAFTMQAASPNVYSSCVQYMQDNNGLGRKKPNCHFIFFLILKKSIYLFGYVGS